MINVLKKLSTAKLTRKEFLVYVGAISLGIIGIPSLLKVVSDVKPNAGTRKAKTLATKPKPHTFGSGAYGV